MRLKKSLCAVVLAASLAVTAVPVSFASVRVQAAEETDNEFKITKLKVAETYYGADQVFPLFVEFEEENGDYNYRKNLKLTVTNEEGKVVAEAKKGDHRNFKVDECQNVEDGKSYDLKFTITNDVSGEEVYTENRTVAFKNQPMYLNRKFISVKEAGISLSLYASTGSAVAVKDDIDGIYLLDKEDKIVCSSSDKKDIYAYSRGGDDRYNGFDYIDNYFREGMNLSISVYRNRKLQSGEALKLAYSVNGEMVITDMTMTATDAPILSSCSRDYRYEPGVDGGVVLSLSGKNIDYKKLSIFVKEPETKEIVGKSVGYSMKYSNAIVTIQWKEGYVPKTQKYELEYQYDGAEICFEKEAKEIVYNDITVSGGEWNPKTGMMECFNSDMPVGAEVSYSVSGSDSRNEIASGSGIKITEKNLLKIKLENDWKNSSENINVRYTFSYKDGEKEIEQDGYASDTAYFELPSSEVQGAEVYVRGLENTVYFSDAENYAFSAGVYSENPENLPDTCKAVITSQAGIVTKGSVTLDRETSKYKYSYEGTLEPGTYTLNILSEDKKMDLSYTFYVVDKEKLSLESQYNLLGEGRFLVVFPSKELGEWYLSDENLEKWNVKILDMQKKEIGSYRYSGENGFSCVDDNRQYCYFKFSDNIKNELKDLYFAYVNVYYDGVLVSSIRDQSKSLYEESQYSHMEIYCKQEQEAASPHLSYIYDMGGYKLGRYTYTRVTGDEKVYPITVVISNWYSVKPLKTFTKEKGKEGFTAADLEGLSEDALYHVSMIGANGTAYGGEVCYLTAEAKEEAPGTDKPGTETPGTDKPGTDTPGTETPGTDKPGTDTPGTDKPGTETPSTDKPGTDTPSTNTPSTNTPSTTTPSTTTPSTTTPETTKPETTTPETNTTTKPSTETKPEETKTESEIKTETKEDGTKVETVNEVKEDGTVVSTVKETKTDGTSTETKELKAADNSASLKTTTETDASGKKTNASAVISTGVSGQNGAIEISKELLESAAASGAGDNLVVEISNTTVESAKTENNTAVVNVSIPKVEGVKVDKVVLNKDSIQSAQASGKGLKVNVASGDEKAYAVSIPAKQLAKIKTSVEELNVAVNTENAKDMDASGKTALSKAVTASKADENKTCIVSVAENKDVENVGINLTIPVTGKADIREGSKVYVYKYNEKTGKLEEIANSKKTVSSDGTVAIAAASGTDYVLSAKKLKGKNVETIKDNIDVSVAKKAAAGKKIKIKVALPDTVSTKAKFGTEKATITYKSSNSKVATVSATGVVNTKKKGTVVITITVKLSSGQKVVEKQKVTVK